MDCDLAGLNLKAAIWLPSRKRSLVRLLATEQHQRHAGSQHGGGPEDGERDWKSQGQRPLEEQASHTKADEQRERHEGDGMPAAAAQVGDDAGDRKSTRLNSSHHSNSYAVFCL